MRASGRRISRRGAALTGSPAATSIYEGDYKAGMREGRGVFRYASGNVYEGDYKAGKMEGRGVYRYADGDVYDGEWKAGKAEGRGVYWYANGNVYEGTFKAGKREGRGVFHCPDSVYDGEYKGGKEGKGGKEVPRLLLQPRRGHPAAERDAPTLADTAAPTQLAALPSATDLGVDERKLELWCKRGGGDLERRS